MSRAEHLWSTTALSLLLLLAVTLVAWLIDRRLIDGASVWAKPIKFEMSLALHFATLALIVSRLGEPWRHSRLLWWIAAASVACTAFEIGYILLQAARQQESHFNLATPLLRTMYVLMAIGAVVITVAAAAVGLAALLDGASRLGPATRIGVVLGLIGGTVLTLVVAFRMGGALSHHVGIEAPGAMRMPLTGWSLSVGDRRVPHFFATHMMQAVPLAGLWLDALIPKGWAIAGVSVFALAWLLSTVGLFFQANAGVPIWRWPG